MSKIFLVQTFPDERRLMSDFLESAGHEAQGFYTDSYALGKFRNAIKNVDEPIIVVSSQRDMRHCDDIGNKVHAELLRLKVPTLTILYARAVGDANFAHIVDLITPVGKHGVVKVQKSSKALSPMDDATIAERQVVKGHIEQFIGSLKVA